MTMLTKVDRVELAVWIDKLEAAMSAASAAITNFFAEEDKEGRHRLLEVMMHSNVLWAERPIVIESLLTGEEE